MHSSSSSGRSPESSSAELDGDHPSPALGLGALGSALGTGAAPRLWQSLEELENPDPAQGAGTEFPCQNSCAEAKSFDFHESERVTQKHPGRKEGGGIPDTDLRQQTNSTFLSSYFRKEGERSSSTGWDRLELSTWVQHICSWGRKENDSLHFLWGLGFIPKPSVPPSDSSAPSVPPSPPTHS